MAETKSSAAADLSKILREATTDANAQMSAPPEPDSSNFAPGAEDTAEVPLDMGNNMAQEAAAPDPAPSVDPETLKGGARLIGRAVSSFLKMLASRLYPARIFQPGEVEIMAEIEAKVESAPSGLQEETFNSLVNSTPGAQSAYAHYLESRRCIEAAPFTEEELDMFADGLAPVMAQTGPLQSPWSHFTLVVLILMLPRLEPLMPGLNSLVRRLKPE